MSYNNQKKHLDKIYKSIENSVKADNKKSFVMEMFVGFFRYPLSNKRFVKEKKNIYQWIKLRNQYLLNKFKENSINILYLEEKNNKIKFLVSVKGLSSFIFDVSDLKKNNIHAYMNLNEKAKKITSGKLQLYPGLSKDNNFYYEQTKDIRVPSYYLFPDYQNYLFEVENINIIDLKEKLKNSFKNKLTKKEVIPNIKNTIKSKLDKISYNQTSLHPWKIKKVKTKNKIVIGPGIINIKRNIISEPNQDIIIVPGTSLLLDKDISIISQGKLIMKGEKGNKS